MDTIKRFGALLLDIIITSILFLLAVAITGVQAAAHYTKKTAAANFLLAKFVAGAVLRFVLRGFRRLERLAVSAMMVNHLVALVALFLALWTFLAGILSFLSWFEAIDLWLCANPKFKAFGGTHGTHWSGLVRRALPEGDALSVDLPATDGDGSLDGFAIVAGVLGGGVVIYLGITIYKGCKKLPADVAAHDIELGNVARPDIVNTPVASPAPSPVRSRFDSVEHLAPPPYLVCQPSPVHVHESK